jgi:hypothetical protein
MGMTHKIEALKTLVEWTEPDDGIADAIEWAIKCFEVVRENRNSVVHGYNFKADQSSGNLFIEKRKNGMLFDKFLQFEITAEALNKIVDEQVNVSRFLNLLQRIIDRRGPEAIGPGLPTPVELSPLPHRCSLPSGLDTLPHQAPQSARRKRKSLQEIEAKASKAERKDGQRDAQRKKNP